jgi:hypothetical protein
MITKKNTILYFMALFLLFALVNGYAQNGLLTPNEVQTHRSSGWGSPWKMTRGDFNGDGNTDLIAYYIGAGNGIYANVFLSDGAGKLIKQSYLTLESTSYHSPWNMMFGDVNGDGSDDAIAYHIGGTAGVHTKVYLNDGTGQFIPGTYQAHRTSGWGSPWSMQKGDFNGDGNTDLIAYFIGAGIGIYANVFLSDGAGNFIKQPYLTLESTSYHSPWNMMFGDVNGDGSDDAIAYHIGGTAGVHTKSFFE